MTRSSRPLVHSIGVSALLGPLLAVGAPLALTACGADDPAGAGGGGPGAGSTTPAGVGGASGEGGSGEGAGAADDDTLSGPCPLGASRACKTHNETGCLTGRQYCVDGEWSDCMRHVGRAMKHRALTDVPEVCGASDDTSDNTCDPACQAIAPTDIPNFGEGTTVPPSWTVGSLGDVPADALQEGLIEPCDNDRDCEFDHYCDEGSGQCILFAPGQINDECLDTYDVSAPVACDGKVILCNRGGQVLTEATAESEMQIRYRAPGNPVSANTYWMDGCALGGVDGTCPVEVDGDIAPGTCVEIPCDVPAGYTIFIDGGSGSSAECDCGNNWTMNPGGACGTPSCGGDVATANQIPLTIFLLVDISLSIQTHWNTIRNGVNAFLQDPANEGIGVVLKFWPSGRCATGSGNCDADGPYNTGGTCAFHPCEIKTTGSAATTTLASGCDPTVTAMCATTSFRRCCNLGTSGTKRWDAACQAEYDRRTSGACTACDHGSIANTSHTLDGYRFTLPAPGLVTAMNGVSSFPGNTPVAEAFTGAVGYARDYMAAHPGERAVVVAPTDADYTSGVSCTTPGNPTETATRGAVSAGAADGVLTFIIGTSSLTATQRTNLDELAADGGTGAATFLTAGGGAAELTNRLQEIANTFACQYSVPAETDPELVSVAWSGAGGEVDLTRVGNVTGCGAGVDAYYFISETEIALCPSTCSEVRDDPSSVVALEIACGVSAAPVTVSAEFTAEGACGEIGTFPKWTLFLYGAEVPTGSSIEVRAATKLRATDADYRTEVHVVSITEANEISDISDPTRLDTALGTDAFGEVLRLELESTVGGGAPNLLDYEVQFTCAPTE